jgi:hypothetical protein
MPASTRAVSNFDECRHCHYSSIMLQAREWRVDQTLLAGKPDTTVLLGIRIAKRNDQSEKIQFDESTYTPF